jgi:hypothetical protein
MKWLIRLYPRAWRERYGAELAALLEDSKGGWWAFVDVAATGLGLRLRACVPVLAGALLGAAMGVAMTSCMTPWQVSSFWVKQAGRTFSQEELNRAEAIGFTRAELGKVIEKHRLFEAERKVQPLAVITAQFRLAIEVEAERGGVRVKYAGPARNNQVAADLSYLVLRELVPKSRRGLTFHMGFGEEETVRPYPIALPALGALLGMAGAQLSTRLRRKNA